MLYKSLISGEKGPGRPVVSRHFGAMVAVLFAVGSLPHADWVTTVRRARKIAYLRVISFPLAHGNRELNYFV